MYGNRLLRLGGRWKRNVLAGHAQSRRRHDAVPSGRNPRESGGHVGSFDSDPRSAEGRRAKVKRDHRDTNSFVAIDFETADYGPDSACAVALVRVEGDRIVQRESHPIRPPRPSFVFTYIHGITWKDVAHQPAFGELWPKIKPLLTGTDLLAAHNARFDQSVLQACCAAARVEPPAAPFLCTVRLARQTWGLRPTRLPDVCRHLGLPLQHHNALSDAEACARIVLAARAGSAATTQGS
ncbi:MAG: 3'-5' exonuclease [Planctomycetes bacterium]|nr:3'-5' exonuclease [Planctomycetota bacterium]